MKLAWKLAGILFAILAAALLLLSACIALFGCGSGFLDLSNVVALVVLGSALVPASLSLVAFYS